MRILIVDDSAIMRKLIRRELESLEVEIYEANDGEEALTKIEEIKPHLVTMDVDMPKMNGFEAVRNIRTGKTGLPKEVKDKLPIVFLTANDTPEGRDEGFESGASEFITKPFVQGELASAVEKLLNPDQVLKGMTALVVEDQKIARMVLTNILEREGIKLLLADNGKSGYEMFIEHEKEIDIVITDYMMPGMDGSELCQKIRHELGNKLVPIIFLSAMSERGSVLDIFRVGATDYIVKPFSKEELLARIRVHLEHAILNKTLQNHVRDLKHLNKLKDDLLSITSHDLRSPITGILGFTDILLEDDVLNEDHKEYLGHIKDSSEFLLALINDILDLSRVQSDEYNIEKQPLYAEDLIHSSLNTLRYMATPKRITLDFENTADKPAWVFGDKGALIRIFNNLLSNAIKFTPANGKVGTVVETDEENRVVISITDNGLGIPEDKIPQLFDRFSKASRAGTAGEKSTGLGLAITKELVERHDGLIEVESEEGKGSCFKLIFPLIAPSDTEEVDKRDIVKNADNEQGNQIRILVADDNPANLKLVRTMLSKKGYEIVGVEDGQAAYDAYIDNTEQPEADETGFDLILMDVNMPLMDGFEATGRIREFEEENNIESIPIIALTAGSGETWEMSCIKAGMNGYIAKPLILADIVKTIQTFCN